MLCQKSREILEIDFHPLLIREAPREGEASYGTLPTSNRSDKNKKSVKSCLSVAFFLIGRWAFDHHDHYDNWWWRCSMPI